MKWSASTVPNAYTNSRRVPGYKISRAFWRKYNAAMNERSGSITVIKETWLDRVLNFVAQFLKRIFKGGM